jgi:hypothetical protein
MSLDLNHAKRAEIVQRWYDRIVDDYPAETSRFLREQADPFANPVGAALRDGLEPILSGILDDRDPSELEPTLDRIVRVRALQDMPPSGAVAFVLELKDVFDEVVVDASIETRTVFGERVETVLLTAFDVYNRCREQIYEIRVNEIRNRSLKVMERLNSWREHRGDRAAPTREH